MHNTHHRLHALCVLVTLVVLFTGLCAAGDWDPTMKTFYTSTQTGDGTFYGKSTGGQCTLDNPPPDFLANANVYTTVAIDDPFFLGSLTCGMCAVVTGKGVGSGATPINGTFLVFVDNRCPECHPGDLDLGTSGDGRWDISWEAVECPVADNKIQYVFVGSTTYYIKLQIRNTRFPTLSVSINQDGTYVPLARTSDNYFTSLNTNVKYPVSTPIGVQLTSVAGDVLYDSIPTIGADYVVMTSTIQFPSSNITGTGSTGSTSDTSTVHHNIVLLILIVFVFCYTM